MNGNTLRTEITAEGIGINDPDPSEMNWRSNNISLTFYSNVIEMFYMRLAQY